MAKLSPSLRLTGGAIRSLFAHPIAKWVGVAVVVSIVASIAYGRYLSSTRYYFIQSKDGFVYEIDRQTGQTWVIHRAGKSKVEEPSAPSSWEVMPSTLRSKVTGQIGPYIGFSAGSFTGDVHNGTGWTIKEVQLQLTAEPKGGSSWSRSFREELTIKPFTSSSISFDIADRRKIDKYTWVITGIRGVPSD